MLDREDYLAKGYKQLLDSNVYWKVNRFKEEQLAKLVSKINSFLSQLYARNIKSEGVSLMNLRMPVALGKRSYYLRFINGYITSESASF